ncbi:hypothetical protein DTO027I6_10266 [Penicillium roqueforti]|nr:hypothetical protein CBS147337_10412 [Penicillium roqueforti]KAI3180931.1 hypothetical protein DTO027I6_10266 [Penicillium roqueforti]
MLPAPWFPRCCLISCGKQPELRTPTRAIGDVVRIPGSTEQTKEWHATGSSITALVTQHPSAAPATWPYQRFYDSASGSPAGGGPVSDSPPLGPAPARLYQINPVSHSQSTTTQLQLKRAQCQRRKDPSCDACRERRDFSDVRSNLRYHGRDILNVPTPYRARGAESLLTGAAVDLPQKHLIDRLLAQYFNCVHSVLPMLYWPIFTSEYEKVYRSGSLLGVSFEWAAVLFGVFACGAIHTMEPNSEEEDKKYARTSRGIINVWRYNFNLDRARAALLASIFPYSPRPIRAKGHVPDLDRHEETISYVSGDMQGTSDGIWVRHGSQTGSQLERMGYASRTTPNCAGQPEIETDVEWEGWD